MNDHRRDTESRLAVPRSTPKGVERRNDSGAHGADQRHASGTIDLKSLAKATLFRLRGGTISGTVVERQTGGAFHPGGNAGPTCEPIGDGCLVAFKIRSRLLDSDVWFVADESARHDNPDISASGLPLFYFDEVERLRGMLREDLENLASINRVFPGARMGR